MLTEENSKSIERVQKSALSIILGPSYICYENALQKTKMERLDQRRTKLSLSFAKKAAKHHQHSSWFNLQQTDGQTNTRSVKPLLKPVQARTQRLSKSPICFLTNLLNDDHAKPPKKQSWYLHTWSLIVNCMLVSFMWPVDHCSRCWLPNQWPLLLYSNWYTVVNHQSLTTINRYYY